MADVISDLVGGARFIPSYKATRNQRLLFRKIDKGLIIKLLREEKYTEIEGLITSWSSDMLHEFLRKNGVYILDWAVVACQKVAPFAFLVDRKEFLNLSELLKDSTLESFVMSLSGGELCGRQDQPWRDIRKEKFHLLLEIDKNHVQDFMQRDNVQKYITSLIREDFELASSQPCTKQTITKTL